MQTKITEKFWEDEGIAALPTDGKLAVLWALTNSGVNLLGITHVTPRKFIFETGEPVEALWRTCEALPSLVRDGNSVLAANFIRYQLGSGPQLAANNIFTSVKRAFDALQTERFRAALLARVPELESPSKPSQSPSKPSEAPPKGKEKEKEKEKEKVGGKGTGEGAGGPPDLAEAPTGGGKKNRASVDRVRDSKRLDVVRRELREVDSEMDALDQAGAEIPGRLRKQKNALEKERDELEALT